MAIPLPPKARFLLYAVGTLVFALVSLLSFFKVIDPNTAATVSANLVSVLGLFGVTVAGTAAYNTNKQRKDGTFDKSPEVAPEDQVINGINAVLAQQQAAQAAADKVKEAVTKAVGSVPVLGPLANQILDQFEK